MTNNFKPLISGVIHVTGEPDVGKTTFALECGPHPSRIAFIDDDGKGKATAEQIAGDISALGKYVDLKERTKGLPQLKMYDECAKIIEEIEAMDPAPLATVWDPWTRFASTMKARVRANPNDFRDPKDWAPLGQIKGAQQWKEAQELEAQWIARLNAVSPVVVLTTHLKNQYVGSRRTGKQIPDASRTIVKVPRFRLWLRRNPSGSPVPVGLVLKRIDVKKYVDGMGLRTVCVLPQRIEPQEGDESLWDAIRRYVADPIGSRQPESHEIPNEFERSLIEGTMTEDQKKAWMLMLAAGAEEIDLDVAVNDEVMEVAQYISEMRERNAGDDAIAKSLREESVSAKVISDAFGSLGDEVSVLQVIQWGKA